MKIKKLLKRLSSYLDQSNDQLREQDDGLSKVLKKLKKKQTIIVEQIASEMNDVKREKLEQNLKIVRSQRKKGIALLSEIREKKKDLRE